MKLLVCIDDTDNLDSKGTGSIADELKKIIQTQGFGSAGVTTRHQLLLHADIPYTSHNSSMCFDCEVNGDCYDTLIPILCEHLKNESAPGSDPGIAIAKKNDLVNSELLIRFGLDAKRSVLKKKLAYATANETDVYLAEVGGEGIGVIGALAGIGLRLGGNDGEAKGGIKGLVQNQIYTVEELLNTGAVQEIYNTDGAQLEKSEKILIEWKAKPMLVKHKFVLTVKSLEKGIWTTLKKNEMRELGNRHAWTTVCERFIPDVEEELVDEHLQSCLNCRYRRWKDKGFVCIR